MRPPSGRQFELLSGDQRAVVVAVGAGLRSYHAAGFDAVDGYEREAMCAGGRGQLLLPWPNRIARGQYRFGELDLQLPLSEPEQGNAIHGLARWLPWSLESADPESVTLSLELPAQPGYPFSLRLTAAYALTADGLAVRVTAQNAGRTPCPFGAGAHPYIRVSDDLIDGAVLHVPAEATLEADARGIPSGNLLDVANTPCDFREARRIGPLRLDTAYSELRRDTAGAAAVTVADRDGERGVTVWMDASHQFVMVYTGDTLADVGRRRRSVAIEPMTCAPDAFNSGLGLIVLQPEETCTMAWGITAWRRLP